MNINKNTNAVKLKLWQTLDVDFFSLLAPGGRRRELCSIWQRRDAERSSNPTHGSTLSLLPLVHLSCFRYELHFINLCVSFLSVYWSSWEIKFSNIDSLANLSICTCYMEPVLNIIYFKIVIIEDEAKINVKEKTTGAPITIQISSSS